MFEPLDSAVSFHNEFQKNLVNKLPWMLDGNP